MFPRFPFFGQRGAGRRWPLYGLVRPVGGASKSCGGRTKRSSFSQCNALTQLAHCTKGSKRIRVMDGRRLLLLLLCVLQLSRLVRSTVLEGGEQLLTPFLNSVGSHVEFVKCVTLIRFQFFNSTHFISLGRVSCPFRGCKWSNGVFVTFLANSMSGFYL